MPAAYLKAPISATYQYCNKIPMQQAEAYRVARGKNGFVRGQYGTSGVRISTRGLQPYRCDRCGEWHVGHAPGTSARIL